MSRLMNFADIWQCPKCGGYSIKGNKCNKCKISYFDTLQKQEKSKRKSPRKPYIPETVSESGILQSFLKRKEEK